MQKGPHGGPFHRGRMPQTRLRYSCVRVSISILSPVSTNSGTAISKPVAILRGLHDLARGVALDGRLGSVISRTTLVGSSTEMALPS